MGKTATARISYGFIIAQPKVLEVLQKLQNSTEKVTKFQYGDGAELLEELLYKHLAERGIGEQIFEMVYLTSGEYDFEGLAILYKGIDGESLTVWGMGSRSTSYTILASQLGLPFQCHQHSNLCCGIKNRFTMRTLHLNVSVRIHCSKN